MDCNTFIVEVMKHAPPLRGVCSDMRHRPPLPVLLLCYKSDVDAESILIIFMVSPNGSSDILKENQRETLNQ